jgi:hypothetical protein
MMWVEAATDLVSARQRIQQLVQCGTCEYVVYDQRTKRIVASVRNPSNVPDHDATQNQST